MSDIKEKLSNLKQRDIYSLGLFSLYKLVGTPEYSSISELAYVLDKNNLLNLCEYFGGQTITIPTIDKFENLIYSLLLYQYVKIECIPYEEAVKLLDCRPENLREVKYNYRKISEILEDYSFKVRADTNEF